MIRLSGIKSKIKKYVAHNSAKKKSSKYSGEKYDSGKLEWSLMPFGALRPMVSVLMFGRDKYSKDNWQLVDNARDRYFDALMRHMIDWKAGNIRDSESGLMTLAHAGCCILFLIWFEQMDVKEKFNKLSGRQNNE